MTETLQMPSILSESTKTDTKLETRDVNAFFGKTQALRHVSLSIQKNHVVAIIGPSGCGKSTYLRCLNRMHEVAGGSMTGTILLDGEDIYQNDPVALRRRVGMVFDYVDLRQCCRGTPAQWHGAKKKSCRRDGRTKSSASRPLGGSKRLPLEKRDESLRRATAKTLHRTRSGGKSGGAADGRASERTGSDFDSEN